MISIQDEADDEESMEMMPTRSPSPSDQKASAIDGISAVIQGEQGSSMTMDSDDPHCRKTSERSGPFTHQRRRYPCLLSSSMLDVFGCPPKSARRYPCQAQVVPGPGLVSHLERAHHIPRRTGRPLVKNYQEHLARIFGCNDPDASKHFLG
jgi:hypothetical protein